MKVISVHVYCYLIEIQSNAKMNTQCCGVGMSWIISSENLDARNATYVKQFSAFKLL